MIKENEEMLKIINLTKAYRNVRAVDDFSLEIEKGHIYGIIGPNGAGKTTFFKLLAGLRSRLPAEFWLPRENLL